MSTLQNETKEIFIQLKLNKILKLSEGEHIDISFNFFKARKFINRYR